MRLPLFPLNAVVFPGAVLPLHVFEDRYRALVRDLRAIEPARDRVFGIVAIREGYEVGDHGRQSFHRVGTLVQLGEVRPHPDGRFDIECTGRGRFRTDEVETGGEYLVGTVTELDEVVGPHDAGRAARTRSLFERYLSRLEELGGPSVEVVVPADPAITSYALAAATVLPLRERQELLEAANVSERLDRIAFLLRAELGAMAAVPSLPATELARTRWSPN